MILVVGATGKLGGMITRGLLERGKDVRILVRKGSNYQPLVEAGATPVFGDLKDRASLDPACRGVDTIVTTATAISRRPPDTLESVDDEGYRRLLDVAKNAGVSRFVFTSALGSDPDSAIPLLRYKARNEQRLRESGMSYAILMPNYFIEVWAYLVIVGPLASGKPVTLSGSGSRRHSTVSMLDVAAFAVAAVDHPAARNAVILIGGPRPVSWAEVLAVAEDALGRKIATRRVSLGEPIETLPPGTDAMLHLMETFDSPIDMSTTARTFGVQLTPIEEAVRSLLGGLAVQRV